MRQVKDLAKRNNLLDAIEVCENYIQMILQTILL